MKILREDNIEQDDSIVSINELLKDNKKVISFLGSKQSGVTFLINNIARIMARRGIDVAILDMTSNKDTYYIYTQNKESIRVSIKNNFKDLSEGKLNGLKVENNLTVYTDLPSEKDETPTKISKAQRLKEKIANAQRFEVQYGGGKEKLVDIVGLEKSGDKQAHMFIETWTKRDPKNLAAYGFIEANGLYTVKGEKKEA